MYSLDIITCDSLTQAGIPRYSLLRSEDDKILSVPPTYDVVFPDSGSDRIEHAKPFGREQPLLAHAFNDWKVAGVLTFGSGRPENVMVSGDPNQDGNGTNDRLPGAGRDSFIGPDYATTDSRLTRRLYVHDRVKVDLIIESFNLLNRDNKRVLITENGLRSDSAYFVKISNELGVNYYPGHFQIPRNPLAATNAYAPRQVQLALKMIF